MAEYYAIQRSEEYLAHYGIKGMKWGIRKDKTDIPRYTTGYDAYGSGLSLRGKLRYGRTPEAKTLKTAIKERTKYAKEWNKARSDTLEKLKNDSNYRNRMAKKYVNDFLYQKKRPKTAEERKERKEDIDYYKTAYRDILYDDRMLTENVLGRKWHKDWQKSVNNLDKAKNNMARVILKDAKKRGYNINKAGKIHGKKIAEEYGRKWDGSSVFDKDHMKKNPAHKLNYWESLSETMPQRKRHHRQEQRQKYKF